MRILNVTAQKPDSTGSGVFLAELVRCQRAAGHEAAVVCGVAADDAVSLPEGVLVRPVRFETPELPFPVCGMSDEMPYRSTRYRDLTPEMAGQFERAFSEALLEVDAAFQPDIVICHHLYLLTAVVRELLGRRRVGAVCHSTDLRQLATHGLARERIAAAVRRLDAVLALHGEQKRQIVEMLGVDPGRVHVVGTGYNSAIFSREGRTPGAGPVAEGRPVELVYAGKIARKKGLLSLLGAMDLMEAPTGARLRLVGGAGDEAEFARIRERARACRWPVELPGRKTQAELARIYRASDVFVLPSFFEGLPLVVAEALACGCSVVATNLPGLRPWLAESIPDAPVAYVEPPRMAGVDEPDPAELPAFERRLARALEEATARPPRFCDAEDLSWEHLTERILRLMSQGYVDLCCQAKIDM